MPRGFGGVREASAEVEARRSSGGPGALWFRLKSGDETVVRFLEQDDDIFWCHVHEVPVPDRAWGKEVPCLDQEKDGTPCPGCEQDLPRKFKGYINVIWEDAPIFKRNNEGRVVKDSTGDLVITGRKPQVAVWSSGIRLFEELAEIDGNYSGLMSRRFKVKRKGEKLDTKYHITPEDVNSGPQDMTEEEQKLAAEKFDLNEFVKPGTYQDFLKAMGQQGPVTPHNGQAEPPKNPFMRNRP